MSVRGAGRRARTPSARRVLRYAMRRSQRRCTPRSCAPDARPTSRIARTHRPRSTTAGGIVAQSEVATPVHLGTTHAVVRYLLGEFDFASLRPGDGLLVNMPYPSGPGHLNDIVVSAGLQQRRADCDRRQPGAPCRRGGYAPGSMPFGVWEIYQEGLQIPPVLAFRDHRLDQAIWRLIAQNIRDPVEVRGDLEARIRGERGRRAAARRARRTARGGRSSPPASRWCRTTPSGYVGGDPGDPGQDICSTT